jgi:hypothetical protein
MEQRPLRLGDILDDYCPRERRVTNHAIVAMIEEDVRQTRCTTCDAEHVYKGGKAPKRRKKETSAALYKEVLAGMPEVDATPILAVPVVVAGTPSPEPVDDEDRTIESDAPTEPREVELVVSTSHDEEADEEPVAGRPVVEEGPVHRQLIRATLPRPEGQKDVRQAPDFTMRQPIGRGHFRGDGRVKPRGPHAGPHNGNGGNGNVNRPHGGQRFGGPRSGGGQGRGPGGAPGRGGPSGGSRSGQPRQGGGGGRKRSR